MKTIVKNIYRNAVNIIAKIQKCFRFCFSFSSQNIPYNIATGTLYEYSNRPQSTCLVVRRLFSHRYNLTIIIPVYNQEDFLNECINSVLSQITSYSCFIVCIDDGSCDNSAVILEDILLHKKHRSSYNFIVVHQTNYGVSGARNAGISLIDSDYVMFLDPDDRLLPDSIDNLLMAAYSKNADVVEGNGYRFDESGKLGGIKKSADELTGYACIKIFRTDLWQSIAFPCNYLFEDTIISTLIYPLCRNICTIPNDIYEYRVHKGSITNSGVRPKLLDSLWIMLQTNDDRKRLNLKCNDDYYDFLINHIELTIRWRIAGFPKFIKYNALEVIRYFIEKECEGLFEYKRMNRRQHLFLTALKKKQYERCLLVFS